MPPPADFAKRPIQFQLVAPHTLLRIHNKDLGPIFYGKAARYRFDDPKQEYGVLYAADTLAIALAETVIRSTANAPTPDGVIPLPERDLEIRKVSILEGEANLRLVDLTGLPLFGMGGNASELQGNDYIPTQAWSAAVYRRPEAPNDGIYYQSRYINTTPAIAIFDRGGKRVNLHAIKTMPLLDHPDLGTALDSMNAVIVPKDL